MKNTNPNIVIARFFFMRNPLSCFKFVEFFRQAPSFNASIDFQQSATDVPKGT
jgi:hypothetical protein